MCFRDQLIAAPLITLKPIQDTIEQLPRVWDAERERNFAPGGRGASLAGPVRREVQSGRFTTLNPRRNP